MSSGEVAALITALGVSASSILMAFAALRNSRYSKERVEILTGKLTDVQAEVKKKTTR